MNNNKIDWPKYTLFENKKVSIYYQIDTFRNAEGYDRIIMNGVRVVMIWLLVILFKYLPNKSILYLILWAIMLILVMALIGITKLKYFQNNKELEITMWV